MKTINVLRTFLASMMAIFTVVISNNAMAHGGHDHAANESMLMHVLFYGSIAVAIAAVVWFAYSKFGKQSNKQIK